MDNNRPKVTRPDKNKKIKFEKERKELLDKIFEIIGITDENRMMVYHDLDSDEKKIESILALKDNIYKYFAATSTKYLKVAKEYMKLLRTVFRQMDVEFTTNIKTIYRDQKPIKSSIMYFL
jgi:hypothetical protein